MNRGEYRKHSKHKCKGCDHPAWCPSKNVNAKERALNAGKTIQREENILIWNWMVSK